jgi:hypothetical protein
MATALTDHDRIREWAEAHGAVPASVRGTGKKGDPGILRLDMPGGAGNESLQPVSWDDWFRKFDAQGLALLVDEQSRASTFNKLVNRTDVNVDVDPAPRSRGAASREPRMANPNRQPNPRGAGPDADQTDTTRDDQREADADVDDLDEEVDDDEFEDDDLETDDDEVEEEEEDEGDDKERA